MENIHRELEEPSNPESERTLKKSKKQHNIWSLTQKIGMPDPITSKEDDAKPRRCFVEQFLDLDGISEWNIFRDISAPIFDLLLIETNRYGSLKNYHLFT